jgi:glycosyltransferase involved in cell wall biosynthesis
MVAGRSSAPPASITVIIAARDEEAIIEATVRRVLAAVDAEVLVVDGGSDRTGEIVERLGSETPRVRLVGNVGDRGKGHAIRVGIAHASGEVMVQLDADMQFLPEDIPRVVAPILAGEADVTLGSRFTAGATRGAGSTPLLRTLGNKTVSGYVSLLCGQRVTDAQAGLKAWTREAAKRIDLQSDNFSYEAEIVVKALRRGLRVRDVPVATAARTTGTSKVSLVRDGARLLRDVTRFRFFT